MAAHPSASVCISASADGTVKIWKYAENKSLVSSLVHPQSKVGRVRTTLPHTDTLTHIQTYALTDTANTRHVRTDSCSSPHKIGTT